MIYVKRWYLNNPLRNYNYLIVNDVNHTALIVDPTMSDHYEQFLAEHRLEAEAVLLTHDHSDHIAAVAALKAKYNIPVYAHFKHYRGHPVDYYVEDNDVLNFNTANCQVITCPGHIASHVSFYFPQQGLLFCGDTIFTAGVGNVKDSTADVVCLYHSIEKLRSLPDVTKLYPAHDYFENNLSFAQSINPQDTYYRQWFNKVMNVAPEDKPITTLADENQMNIFFRVNEVKLQEMLRQANVNVVDAKTAFCELRARKDVF
ncbi:hydroxyacylglutathione hydrolase [Cysteiniphilum halobium]|uniref:hydroxyacylglutathione hydrolase n=1 Tax=Cysteiniphilum halobium TaxID=2219059 RepID=UPI000E65CC8C|nr:hydroxyacylglutathione hydrolase [Cysteiniphilum halobium]